MDSGKENGDVTRIEWDIGTGYKDSVVYVYCICIFVCINVCIHMRKRERDRRLEWRQLQPLYIYLRMARTRCARTCFCIPLSPLSPSCAVTATIVNVVNTRRDICHCGLHKFASRRLHFLCKPLTTIKKKKKEKIKRNILFYFLLFSYT